MFEKLKSIVALTAIVSLVSMPVAGIAAEESAGGESGSSG